MQNHSLDYFSYLYNNPNILLTNCGFSPDFFSKVSQNMILFEKNNDNMKKIRSENDIISLQMKRRRENFENKKIFEAEDKDIYNKIKENKINNFYKYKNPSNNSLYDFSAFTTIPSQEHLDKFNKNNSEIIKNNNYLIKAYKSKLKKKYSKLYEKNSINLEEKNKYKLFHKCCYPGCNRTFSSSGWLKAHLDKHLNQIHNSKYCKLFENYLLNEHYEKIQKDENHSG
jgi:ribosomal protein L16 Arg81 hydroxylase